MIKGNRRPDDTAGNLLDPGDFALQASSDPPAWLCCTPNGVVASLAGHAVEENADGSISVTPSVAIDDEASGISWRGDLTGGVWTEAEQAAAEESQPAEPEKPADAPTEVEKTADAQPEAEKTGGTES